jgi:hypothetical protein
VVHACSARSRVTACAQGVKHVAMCECGLHMVQATWQQDSKLRAFAYVWILPPSSVHKPAWLAHYMQHQLTPMGSLAALLTFTAHLMQHQLSSLSLHDQAADMQFCSQAAASDHCISSLVGAVVRQPLRLHHCISSIVGAVAQCQSANRCACTTASAHS